MGYTHFEGARGLKNAKVAAIATRDQKKLAGDWTSIQGNFGPRGGQVDLSAVKKYADYHDLLNDPEIDLVDVCLPTELHEKVTLESLAAGKHTLVEKPISTELAAADRMVRAAEKAGKLLMVGQVLPFFPEFAWLADAIKSKKYGALRAAHFRRVICPPDWSAEMSDFRRLGGWGIDLHIHDNHFICLTCGVPKAVFAGGILQDGLVNHVHSQYVYPNASLAVSCVSGGIAAKGLAFAHGFEAYFDEATVLFSAGTLAGQWVVDRPLTVVTNDGQATSPTLASGSEWCSGFTAELQEAVNAVRSGQPSRMLSGELARDALKVCFAEAESIGSGRPVELG
jgi:predicted dehydrogenase